MRTDRIVQRHNQRDQLANLKTMMRESRPLIEADKQLRKAYMAGYRRRVEEEIAEDKAKQDAILKDMNAGLDPATVDDAINQELSPEDNLPVVKTGYMQVVDEMTAVPSELEQKQEMVEQTFAQANGGQIEKI